MKTYLCSSVLLTVLITVISTSISGQVNILEVIYDEDSTTLIFKDTSSDPGPFVLEESGEVELQHWVQENEAVLADLGDGNYSYTVTHEEGIPDSKFYRILHHAEHPLHDVMYTDGFNVGIGTESPGKKLHLHSDEIDGPDIFFTSSESGQVPGADGTQIGMDGLGHGFFWNYESDKDLRFGAGNFERMRIDSSGNVGIGTNNPVRPLHIHGDGGNSAVVGFTNDEKQKGLVVGLDSDGIGRIHLIDSGSLKFLTNNALRMTIQNNGSINMLQSLTVAGNFNLGGSIKGEVLLENDGEVQPTLNFRDSNTQVRGLYVGLDPVSDASIYSYETNDLYLGTADVERIRIEHDGPVRIMGGDLEATAVVITSDRNKKSGFEPVNHREVLNKVASLPISRWHYKTNEDVPHIGPMAQDFYAAFGVGSDDKHIATVDSDGVALAAIKGLVEVIEEKDFEIETLNTKLKSLELRFERLEASIDGVQ